MLVYVSSLLGSTGPVHSVFSHEFRMQESFVCKFSQSVKTSLCNSVFVKFWCWILF